MRTTGVIVTYRTNPIAQLAVEGRIRTLAPTCPCGAPATGDYPGIGLACDACLRRQRRAASSWRPVVGAVDHDSPGGDTVSENGHRQEGP